MNMASSCIKKNIRINRVKNSHVFSQGCPWGAPLFFSQLRIDLINKRSK
jgi:hypothetical protein